MIAIELGSVSFTLLEGTDGARMLLFMDPDSKIQVRVPFDEDGFARFKAKLSGIEVPSPVFDASSIKRR